MKRPLAYIPNSWVILYPKNCNTVFKMYKECLL